jgi:hypothetical protein
MLNEVAGIKIPDTILARDAQDILREHGGDLLWNHSNRAFLFGAITGKRANKKFDLELLYISALFHDLGLTKEYSSPDLRFEVDGANAARSFLQHYQVPDESIRLVWDAVALHTTVGIAEHKESEVSLLNSGVSLDVVGKGFEQFPVDLREEIIKAFPRNNFKQDMIPAFYEGFKHKPETTYGNMNSDVIKFFEPNYKQKNYCEGLLHSPWKN